LIVERAVVAEREVEEEVAVAAHGIDAMTRLGLL
jgi:hypothetical protein